jgi:hypothetical protein
MPDLSSIPPPASKKRQAGEEQSGASKTPLCETATASEPVLCFYLRKLHVRCIKAMAVMQSVTTDCIRVCSPTPGPTGLRLSARAQCP